MLGEGDCYGFGYDYGCGFGFGCGCNCDCDVVVGGSGSSVSVGTLGTYLLCGIGELGNLQLQQTALHLLNY